MTKKYKSPISWYGGKFYISKKIIPFVPNHSVYVEVFGGAGHLLFSKTAARIDVYNDINEYLYKFFSILRNPIKNQKLRDALFLTPYSRKEFEMCMDF